jgi:hypothetical protein
MSGVLRIGDMRSRFRVYRSTESTGSLRSVTAAWAPQRDLWGGFLPMFLTLRSYGAGEAPTGVREVQVYGGADVRARDGMEVLRGPERGTKWRVIDVDEADPKWWKLRLEPYAGTFD